jgi:hypothetical protein
MSGTSAFWTHLQSKPRYHALHPQKFSYTELIKLLAFQPGCALRDCLNHVEPWTSKGLTLRPRPPPLGSNPLDTALVDLRQRFRTVCAFNHSLQYNEIGICVTYHFIHWCRVHLAYQQELCQMSRWTKFKETLILFFLLFFFFIFFVCVNWEWLFS